jgi:hypothetical protein
MVIFHKVNLDLNNNQLKNLVNKKAINIKHNQLGTGIHIVHVSDKTLQKMDKTNKLKKGFRLKLNDDEHNETMEDGEGIGRFFKSIGRSFKKVAEPVANNLLEHAPEYADLALTLSGESIKNNNVNNISMPLKKGSEEAKEKMAKLRAMKKGGGMEMGDGIFSSVKNIAKKGLNAVAKKGIEVGTEKLKESLAKATGNQKLADAIGNTLGKSAKAVADGKNPVNSLKTDIKNIASDAVHDYSSGGKIRRRRKKSGKGIDMISPMYNQAMMTNYGIHPMEMAGSGMRNHLTIMPPSYPTYSPYANMSSPQMHPYTPMYNPFAPYLSYAHYHSGKGLY